MYVLPIDQTSLSMWQAFAPRDVRNEPSEGNAITLGLHLQLLHFICLFRQISYLSVINKAT